MTYSRNLALKEGKCHGSLKRRKRQVKKKFFFNYYWESTNLFGNRGEDSSEETVMSWGGSGGRSYLRRKFTRDRGGGWHSLLSTLAGFMPPRIIAVVSLAGSVILGTFAF